MTNTALVGWWPRSGGRRLGRHCLPPLPLPKRLPVARPWSQDASKRGGRWVLRRRRTSASGDAPGAVAGGYRPARRRAAAAQPPARVRQLGLVAASRAADAAGLVAQLAAAAELAVARRGDGPQRASARPADARRRAPGRTTEASWTWSVCGRWAKVASRGVDRRRHDRSVESVVEGARGRPAESPVPTGQPFRDSGHARRMRQPHHAGEHGQRLPPVERGRG